MNQLSDAIYENDPLMVPTKAIWDQMSESERNKKETEITTALEREFNLMGEITMHFDSRASATEVLRRHFNDEGRKVFIASDLHTLYPGERAFYPDLMVVFDVENHHRRNWNVLRENKGLDFALEILSRETKRKDQVEKLNLYARVGIPEYFMFDPELLKVRGYQLVRNIYREIPQENGSCYSTVLGLRIKVESDKLRFYHKEGSEIPFANELMLLLNEKLSYKDHIIDGYAKQLDEEAERAEEEKKRADEALKLVEVEKRRADEALKLVEVEKRHAEKEKQQLDQALEEIKQLKMQLKSNK